MDKIQIQESDLKLNQPLPWPIFDQDGKLLLKRNEILNNQKQIQNLIERGIFRQSTPEEDAKNARLKQKSSIESPFVMLNAIKRNLARILHDMQNHLASDYSNRVYKLSKVIQKLCYENADAALGAVLLDQKTEYTRIHPVLCAILVELMSKRLQIPTEQRQSTIAAALTQNIGMLDLQEELTQVSAPLSTEQEQAVKVHPQKSTSILKALKITDQSWLDTVLYHHERPDGSGYPLGLQGEKIPSQARLLSLVDIYSAMILPRKYRDGFYVKRALQDIFLTRGKAVDEQLAGQLIKEIGIYPPGSFVTLANGDIAIVLRRGVKKANAPVCLSVLSPRGAAYSNPAIHDTFQDKLYSIEEVIPRVDNLELELHEIWGTKS